MAFGFLKGKKFKKVVRTIHKIEGRVLKVAAPIAGAVFLGPVGAAAGTALGTAASYYGEKQGALAAGHKGAMVKKAGRRGLKSGLIIGGIVTGGSAVLAIAGGTGIATGSGTALSNIFGGGAASSAAGAAGAASGGSGYGASAAGIVTSAGLQKALGPSQSPRQYGDYGQDENGFVTDNGLNQSLGGGSPGSSGSSGFNWGALTGASTSIGATGAPTGDRDFGQLGALLNSNIAGIPTPLLIGGLIILAVAL